MATTPRPFLASAPATRTIRVSNVTLFALAAQFYADPMLWTIIAQVNGLSDPWVSGVTALAIPAAPPQTGPASGLLNP
jgi:hypothetical protein